MCFADIPRPKPFQLSDTERCIAYDLKVVDEWLSHLKTYTGKDGGLRDKHVLELGPGSDLGVGVYLLAKGAAGYNACDVNDLDAACTRRAFTRPRSIGSAPSMARRIRSL